MSEYLVSLGWTLTLYVTLPVVLLIVGARWMARRRGQ